MKKLFTNDKFFEAVSIIVVLSGIFCMNECLVFKEGYLKDCIIMLFAVFCVIALYVSYKEHSKNVMKGLMGSILAIGVTDSVSRIGTATDTLGKICCGAYVLLAFFIFVNHFVINSEHHSSPVCVLLNQIAAILISVDIAIWRISGFKNCSGIWDTAENVFFIVLFTGIIVFLVCVESRLDSFRSNREEAGWSEEKGYPENYVHESSIDKDV